MLCPKSSPGMRRRKRNATTIASGYESQRKLRPPARWTASWAAQKWNIVYVSLGSIYFVKLVNKTFFDLK